MTDTTEPAPEPWLHWEGQVWSRESAAEALRNFDADKELVAKALGGDIDAQQVRSAMRQMSRGIQPGVVPQMPSDSVAVGQQIDEREQQILQARKDTFARRMEMTPQRRFEMQRGLATKEQIEYARNEIARAKRDPEFARKVISGDRDAGERWAAWHFVAHHCREAPPGYKWTNEDGTTAVKS